MHFLKQTHSYVVNLFPHNLTTLLTSFELTPVEYPVKQEEERFDGLG
jgi:hypothetical protein